MGQFMDCRLGEEVEKTVDTSGDLEESVTNPWGISVLGEVLGLNCRRAKEMYRARLGLELGLSLGLDFELGLGRF